MFGIRALIVFSVVFAGISLPSDPAFAGKQKYTRRYQKKEPVYQKKTPSFQKRDLRNSQSYLEVSRKMPNVTVSYTPSQTAFFSGRENVVCRGLETFGCTFFGVNFSVETDCGKSQISLNVTESPEMRVELSSAYPQGSCPFDRILAHELSHERAYRTILDSFLADARRKLAQAYVSGQRDSKKCEEVKRRVDEAAAGFAGEYLKRAEAENAKLDFENGAHKYDFDACRQREEESGRNELK